MDEEINKLVDANKPIPVPTCGTDPDEWTEYVRICSYLGRVQAGWKYPNIETHLETCESHRRALEVFHTRRDK